MDENQETAADWRDALTRNGFVRCDIAACNCGGWHARYGLPERWAELKEALSDAGHPLCNDNGNMVSKALAALIAERDSLRAELATFTPLRAKGVVDADDNLDCWDTNPYEICTRHVATLNEKDPAAMWRVVDLFARDEGPNARLSGGP